MKIFYSVLLIIVIILMLGLGYVAFREEPGINDREEGNDLEEMSLGVEFVPEEGIESQEIKVVNDEGVALFQLTIDELNQWTEANWGIFEEPPEVAMREVDPSGFGFFDRAASISPDNKRLVFSVSDYAAATTVSFVILADIETGEIEMVSELARGGVDDYVWSDDGDLVAYTLSTARAGGDFLRVDDVEQMEKSFVLNEEDLLSILDPDEELVEMGQFMPVFGDLEWRENRLYFSSEHPEDDRVRWSVAVDGSDLKVEDQVTYESSVLDVSFDHSPGAEIGYENDRLKITYVGPNSQMMRWICRLMKT